jgi:hypothetical protein
MSQSGLLPRIDNESLPQQYIKTFVFVTITKNTDIRDPNVSLTKGSINISLGNLLQKISNMFSIENIGNSLNTKNDFNEYQNKISYYLKLVDALSRYNDELSDDFLDRLYVFINELSNFNSNYNSLLVWLENNQNTLGKAVDGSDNFVSYVNGISTVIYEFTSTDEYLFSDTNGTALKSNDIIGLGNEQKKVRIDLILSLLEQVKSLNIGVILLKDFNTKDIIASVKGTKQATKKILIPELERRIFRTGLLFTFNDEDLDQSNQQNNLFFQNTNKSNVMQNYINGAQSMLPTYIINLSAILAGSLLENPIDDLQKQFDVVTLLDSSPLRTGSLTFSDLSKYGYPNMGNLIVTLSSILLNRLYYDSDYVNRNKKIISLKLEEEKEEPIIKLLIKKLIDPVMVIKTASSSS